MLSFWKSKPTITDKTLEQNKIKIIPKADIKIDKSSCLAITGSGTFYKGLYKNDAVSIKVVDISKNESILNEFIYWQEFKNDDSFLKFYGAYIQGSEAFLILEFFSYTLETALNDNKIKEENKIKIAKRSLKILESLQHQKKLTRDFRPGVLGFTDRGLIKLIDFGFLICDKLINQEQIEKQRLKYVPPEAFLFLVEDITHDIWSFGCLLIDLFSKDQQIFKLDLNFEELYKLHNNNLFPSIPVYINGLLKDIISKCLERNYQDRIGIDELSENLNILLDTLSKRIIKFLILEENETFQKYGMHRESKGGESSEFFSSTNPTLIETNQFISKLDKTLTNMNNTISDDLLDRTITLKNTVESGQEQTVHLLSENYTMLKEILSDNSMFKIEILDRMKEKIMINILQMQQYYGVAMVDIVDAQNIINDMKVNVNSLSKMANADKYTNVFESLKENRALLEDHVNNYSNKQDYDKIIKIYEENREIVEMFRTFICNRELLMHDILDVVKKHQENFIKNSNVKLLCSKLDIDSPILKGNASESKSINEIFAKVQENSNIVLIYDIEKKIFNQINVNDRKFNSKCFSFYDRDSKSVYISGGINQNRKIENCFVKMTINLKQDKFEFDFKNLNSMNEVRSNHFMVEYNNFLIVIGGTNTKTCEIYNKDKNVWKYLPELPKICANSSVGIINNCLFAFCGSSDINSFDSIYMLTLNNISKILSNDKGFENILIWEKIEYYFNYGSTGRLRKGMGALSLKPHGILLLGGFDADSIYDEIYDFNPTRDKEEKNKKKQEKLDIQMKNKNKNKKIEENSDDSQEENNNYEDIEEESDDIKIFDTGLRLPIKAFFNSNILLFDDYMIMVDGYNNAIELNLKTREFFYYT